MLYKLVVTFFVSGKVCYAIKIIVAIDACVFVIHTDVIMLMQQFTKTVRKKK